MSNKGKVFSHADLPRSTQQRIKNQQVSEAELARLNAHLASQTARNAIVARDDETGLEFIAEELNERSMRKHADGDDVVLTHLRNLMTLRDDQRAVVLGAFDKKAALRIPFTKVK